MSTAFSYGGEILLCTHNSQLEPYMGTSLIRKRVQAEAAKRKHCREALRLITLAWTAHGVLDMPLARRYCEQVRCAGCRVQGAGCSVQGAGFRVHGSGFSQHFLLARNNY